MCSNNFMESYILRELYLYTTNHQSRYRVYMKQIIQDIALQTGRLLDNHL